MTLSNHQLCHCGCIGNIKLKFKPFCKSKRQDFPLTMDTKFGSESSPFIGRECAKSALSPLYPAPGPTRRFVNLFEALLHLYGLGFLATLSEGNLVRSIPMHSTSLMQGWLISMWKLSKLRAECESNQHCTKNRACPFNQGFLIWPNCEFTFAVSTVRFTWLKCTKDKHNFGRHIWKN